MKHTCEAIGSFLSGEACKGARQAAFCMECTMQQASRCSLSCP